MGIVCIACSRRIASRSILASTSRLLYLPPSRANHYTTCSLIRQKYPPNHGLLSPNRLATTSSINTSRSDVPDSPPPIPPRPIIKVIAPNLEAIKQNEFFDEEGKLLPPEEAFLNITPEAIQQLMRITSRESLETLQKGRLALRIGVESGGCHGYQYTMDLTEKRDIDDYILQPESVACIPVIVDITSFGLLKGATLHYATELIGSSFRLQDNPQAKEGGACGCGVSWEAKQ
ncbi:uncharacterized protein L203_103738 [Cryptococcus depauperatus CBS 7841]|uniref:Core domain-containing protein n=1 Tax=Cryptococcus depauperatus CBS 7841 TaxID=1295531 RepID=A0A1E3IEH2_9TREE|nr:hypothetical protein L203_03764 [Cryptococcus depauperatus CBS 7841]